MITFKYDHQTYEAEYFYLNKLSILKVTAINYNEADDICNKLKEFKRLMQNAAICAAQDSLEDLIE